MKGEKDMAEKTLGILGGVGPLATVYFADLIVKMTPASCDQDHIRTIVSNNPKIPDRTDYILDRTKPDPLPAMVADAKMLASLGCDLIAIPCNTAHFFYDEIQKNVDVRVLNIIEETLKFAQHTVPDAKKIGILATSGTLQSNVYPHVAERFGIECVYPDAQDAKTLMHIIYDEVKAGKPADEAAFFAVVERMKAAGCDAVILGCTELSAIYYELQIRRQDILDSFHACMASSPVVPIPKGQAGTWSAKSFYGESGAGGEICVPTTSVSTNHISAPKIDVTLHVNHGNGAQNVVEGKDDKERGAVINIGASAKVLAAGLHRETTVHDSCPGGKSNRHSETKRDFSVNPDTYKWSWSVGGQSGTATGSTLLVSGIKLPRGKYTVSVSVSATSSRCPACGASASASKQINVGNGVIK